MHVEVLNRSLEPWTDLAAYERDHPELRGKVGAAAVFVGTLRDFNQGARVSAMELEHYPAMTERYLARIAQAADARWSLLDALVLHRYGSLSPGDPIVLVAVWSSRRAEAFAACRYIIDELKTRAPFWKREQTSQGARWVEPGD